MKLSSQNYFYSSSYIIASNILETYSKEIDNISKDPEILFINPDNTLFGPISIMFFSPLIFYTILANKDVFFPDNFRDLYGPDKKRPADCNA